jgi:hypothetical protein
MTSTSPRELSAYYYCPHRRTSFSSWFSNPGERLLAAFGMAAQPRYHSNHQRSSRFSLETLLLLAGAASERIQMLFRKKLLWLAINFHLDKILSLRTDPCHLRILMSQAECCHSFRYLYRRQWHLRKIDSTTTSLRNTDKHYAARIRMTACQILLCVRKSRSLNGSLPMCKAYTITRKRETG